MYLYNIFPLLLLLVQANPSHIRPHKPTKHKELESSSLGIHFVVGNQHFIHGKLKVKLLIEN